jgi:hypothetical protein
VPDGSISLPARLYLLAWDTARLRLTSATRLPHLVRAGALTELAQRGLLVDVDGVATPADPDAHAGDVVLDGLLELVEESMPRPWKAWVTLHAGVTLDAVHARLAADGLLRADKKRVLGLFPSVEYELERTDVVERLQQDVRQVLMGPAPVAEASDRDAALAALAAAAGLRTVATAEERTRHKERIEALTDRSGAAAPALGKVVHEVRAAVTAAVSATTAGAGG